MSETRWHRIWREADARWMGATDELARLADSRLGDERLLALFIIRRRIDYFGPLNAYLDAARSSMTDDDADCRFMAGLVLAELMPWYPELAWSVICKQVELEDSDARQLATNLLLKQLLMHHGESYQPQVDARTKTSPGFARTYALRLMSAAR